MADIITRFKGDTSDLDAKVKRGSKVLQQMEQDVRRTGATFQYADEQEIAFAKSLGKMETVASSTKGKLRELTQSAADLTTTYNAMTTAEKKSDFGKALAGSIDMLKARAAELQDQVDDLNQEIHHMASDTTFSDGMNLMTNSIGACASAVVAWSGDGKEMEAVIKDLAKIQTTVKAVEALTKAFQKQNLVLLKNPYVAAAAAAVALGFAIYEVTKRSMELDRVTKALNDVQAKGRENSAQEVMRISALNDILHDNTRSIDERKDALQAIQNLVPEYHGALDTEGNLINDNSDALNTYVANLQKAATAQAAFDRMVELQKQKLNKQIELQQKTAEYERRKAIEESTNSTTYIGATSYGMSFQSVQSGTANASTSRAKSDMEGVQSEINDIDREIQALQKLADANTIAGKAAETRVTKTHAATVKAEKPEKATAGQSLGELGRLEEEAQLVRNSMKFADNEDEYQTMAEHLKEVEDRIKTIRGELPVTENIFPEGSLNALSSELKELQEDLYNMAPGAEGWAEALQKVVDKERELKAVQDQISASTTEGTTNAKQTEGAWKGAASALSQAGGAMQSIENPAAKVAGIIAQAIASVALGLGEALSTKNKETSSPWEWIAAAISGTATMISTIAAIKSATSGYAQGGIVGSLNGSLNSPSGDNIVARLNAGEGVLTRTGIETAQRMSQGGGMANLHFEKVITGSDIRLILTNDNRARGGSRGAYAIR